jgi:cytochrome c peroxidase
VSLCAFVSLTEGLFKVPAHFPKPAYNFKKNPLSAARVQLGRTLFYDPILSRDSMISCSSCHLQYTAFTHVDHALSHGIQDRIGRRNAPALMNLAWHKSFMWDGAINHLDMQALAPISNASEMDETPEHVVEKLQRNTSYPVLFKAAFGDSVVTSEHLLKAMSQFMLTLVSANSKYDQVILKKAKFTTQEQNGYKLFQKHCNSCHTEPLFTNLQFENNGLTEDSILQDKGRMQVTQIASDAHKFKVPTLRNIEFSMPYMHDGRFKRLSEVLKHYTSEIHSSPTLSAQLSKPISLTSNEKVDLIAFLLTLTDRTFLFDPRFSYPK